MREQKTHIPRWQGDAPADYDGGPVEFDWANEPLRTGWDELQGKPIWQSRFIYRYTPAAAKEPSERAIRAAADLLGKESPTIVIARMIEKHEPELLVDPLVALLIEALAAVSFDVHQDDAPDLAAEIRKRGPEFIAAVGEGA